MEVSIVQSEKRYLNILELKRNYSEKMLSYVNLSQVDSSVQKFITQVSVIVTSYQCLLRSMITCISFAGKVSVAPPIYHDFYKNFDNHPMYKQYTPEIGNGY